jgi:hypothetical protein
MLELEAAFASRVAAFYRARGYDVKENARVRGGSQNVYAVAMVADGPLGALLVSFGDAGGLDPHEVGRVRTMARDIGATPVLAAPHVPPELRRLAAQMAVVVLDEAALAEPAGGSGPALRDAARADLEAHPWPDSGRVRPFPDAGGIRPVEVDDLLADLTRSRPAPRRDPLSARPAEPAAPFSWLEPAKAQAPPPVPTGPAAAPVTPPPVAAPLATVPGPAASAPPIAIEYEALVAARTGPLTRRALARALAWGGSAAFGALALLWLFG